MSLFKLISGPGRVLTMLLSMGVFLPAALQAYETDWNDPKMQDKSSKPASSDNSGVSGLTDDMVKNSSFKLNGVIFAGYEFIDRSSSKKIDSGVDKTGFTISRTYLNFRGDVKDGKYKGWGFRITPDIEKSTAGKYTYFLKFAYINVPLARGGKTMLRLGQQQIPEVAGQAGVDFTALWGHRYLAKTSINQLGLSDTADRGLAFIHKSDYFGIHALLSNGEGYKTSDAQGVGSTSDLDTLSAGTGNSYGYDFHGLVSLIPTGKSRTINVSINYMIREQNIRAAYKKHQIIGSDRSEYTYDSLDVSDPANPTYSIIRGQSRAQRDRFHGVEIDARLTVPLLTLTVGGGIVSYTDRRGTVYKIDETVINGVNPADIATISSHMKVEEDRKGAADYIFAHVKIWKIGLVGRYMYGTSGSSLTGRVAGVSHKPWLNTMINADATDGVYGNLSYSEALNAVQGRGRFQNILLGVTYHANSRFRVTLGMTRLTGRDPQGRSYQENRLENITDGAGTSVADQLEDPTTGANALMKGIVGYGANDTFRLNDFIGKETKIQETFLRAQYLF